MAPDQNIQNKDTSSDVTSDAKPRLKWTPDLHQRFIDAIAQLGGPEKATPKSLMRVMSVHGLTLYHLKSHLQKYRLGRGQESPEYSQFMQEINFDDSKITESLPMQMEVQRKPNEQIEVQRHLQLRVEAQGRYLQFALRKAQETLNVGSSILGAEIAKTDSFQLVSTVINGSPSPLSVSTELEDRSLKNDVEIMSSMEMNRFRVSGTSNYGSGRKRSLSTICDCVNCGCGKRLDKGCKKFDLNN